MTAEKIDKIRGFLKVGINTHKPAYGKADPCGGGGSDCRGDCGGDCGDYPMPFLLNCVIERRTPSKESASRIGNAPPFLIRS